MLRGGPVAPFLSVTEFSIRSTEFELLLYLAKFFANISPVIEIDVRMYFDIFEMENNNNQIQ